MPDRAGLAFSAWNPGLEADLPRRYQALETIHHPANVDSRLADIPELKALTGLAEEELVAFKADRLVLHEVIVQVTADIVVLEGEEEELLGQHFRDIARTILSDYLAPHLTMLREEHALLEELEIPVRIGFDPEQLPNEIDRVIIGNAVPRHNRGPLGPSRSGTMR